eukprot:3015760-Rhodomonas_salina.4
MDSEDGSGKGVQVGSRIELQSGWFQLESDHIAGWEGVGAKILGGQDAVLRSADALPKSNLKPQPRTCRPWHPPTELHFGRWPAPMDEQMIGHDADSAED